MAIITLTTDMGLSDYYVAAVKGSILTQMPEVTIVDVSHSISPFDRFKAGFVLKNAFHHFPDGTVHIIGVETFEDEATIHVAVKIHNHFFVGADSGIFSLMFPKQIPDEIVQLNIQHDDSNKSSPMFGAFLKAACHIAKGGQLEQIGRKIGNFRQSLMLSPTLGQMHLGASVVHIDTFGNVITNLHKDLFEEQRQNRRFGIVFRSSKKNISRLSDGYNDVPDGEICAFFNSSDHLEIALNRASLARLFGAKLNDIIRIEFYAD
jgi:S-adenosylmethionine hydrolase